MLIWGRRALSRAVSSMSQATRPGRKEVHRQDSCFNNRAWPVHCRTLSFQTWSYQRIPSSYLKYFWWKLPRDLTSAASRVRVSVAYTVITQTGQVQSLVSSVRRLSFRVHVTDIMTAWARSMRCIKSGQRWHMLHYRVKYLTYSGLRTAFLPTCNGKYLHFFYMSPCQQILFVAFSVVYARMQTKRLCVKLQRNVWQWSVSVLEAFHLRHVSPPIHSEWLCTQNLSGRLVLWQVGRSCEDPSLRAES